MGGVYCRHCQTQVTLEQDGTSCSNCGAGLVAPISDDSPPPKPPPKKKVKKKVKRR